MNARDKATRYLTEGRVSILADRVDAHVRGDEGEYFASVWLDGRELRTACTCPAGAKWKANCSHVQTLLRVWHPNRTESTEGGDV